MKLLLPPEVPDTLAKFDLAMGVLGARVRGDELTEANQRFLEDSFGAYPSPSEAKAWRRALRGMRADLLEQRDAAKEG